MNPYQAPQAAPDVPGPRLALTCPRCGHRMPLTWRRYARAPLGGHACAACGARFRLRHDLRWYGPLLLLFLFFCVVPALLVTAQWGDVAGTLTYGLCVAAMIALDKRVDENLLGDVTFVLKNGAQPPYPPLPSDET